MSTVRQRYRRTTYALHYVHRAVKTELENAVHIELNNMIIKPDTGD